MTQEETTATEASTQPAAATESAAPEPKAAATEEKPVKHRTMRAALRAEFRKSGSEEKAPEVAAKPQQAAPEAPKPAADDAEAVEPILPPPSLKPEERAVWDTLPPAAQKFLARRAHETTADYNRRMQEVSAKEKQLGDWQTLAEAREEAQRLGLDPATTYRTAIAWEKAFRANPRDAALQYLQAYGIDPRELVGAGGGQQQPQQQANGQYMTREEFAAWQREVQEAQSLQSNQTAVDNFMKGKPLFRDPGTGQELEAKMAPIVKGMYSDNPQRPIAEILEEAYHLVTRGDPRFSELLEKLNGREAAAKSAKEAEAARAATRSISGGPGGGAPAFKPKTRTDALRLAFQGRL